MIQFLLNDKKISTLLPPGSSVLDFIRYEKRLSGTKIGCREGDCGACTVLVGQMENGRLTYRSMTSCLMPLINANGKHIVTVEGINMKELSPVQAAMVETNGTQCGFCTLGFIMSFTGFVLHPHHKSLNKSIEHIDGNICRCTGYKSIERAAEAIAKTLENKPAENTMEWLVQNGFIPGYFTEIPEKLKSLQPENQNDTPAYSNLETQSRNIGGGTDLMVQKHDEIKKSNLSDLLFSRKLKGIFRKDGKIHIGASVTVTEFSENPEIQAIFPNLRSHIKLVSSTPIRNMATLAGNLINASPIGDMTVFLLAMNAEVELSEGQNIRRVALRDFYKGYKVLDLKTSEIMHKIIFPVPEEGSHFNFEKVCKRTHLDIASVNSACLIRVQSGGRIDELSLSAGGVYAHPKWLGNTSAFLTGKILNGQNLAHAMELAQSEISPISDARGSAMYKRLLLRQLLLAHFMPFVPESELKDLLEKPVMNPG